MNELQSDVSRAFLTHPTFRLDAAVFRASVAFRYRWYANSIPAMHKAVQCTNGCHKRDAACIITQVNANHPVVCSSAMRAFAPSRHNDVRDATYHFMKRCGVDARLEVTVDGREDVEDRIARGQNGGDEEVRGSRLDIE
jgi:hypothetical protein